MHLLNFSLRGENKGKSTPLRGLGREKKEKRKGKEGAHWSDSHSILYSGKGRRLLCNRRGKKGKKRKKKKKATRFSLPSHFRAASGKKKGKEGAQHLPRKSSEGGERGKVKKKKKNSTPRNANTFIRRRLLGKKEKKREGEKREIFCTKETRLVVCVSLIAVCAARGGEKRREEETRPVFAAGEGEKEKKGSVI